MVQGREAAIVAKVSCRTMRYALIILMLGLLLTACHRSDTRLRGQVIGTWTRDEFSTMTIALDGSFAIISRENGLTNSFAGTWQINDSIFIMTITNAPAVRGHSLVGGTECYTILAAHEHQLLCAETGQSFTLNR
jgi:hypothetical protein